MSVKWIRYYYRHFMLKFVWVNSSIVALWRYMTTQTFVNTDLYNGLSYRLLCAKPLPKPMLTYCQLDPNGHILWTFIWNSHAFVQGNTFENVVCKMPSCCNTGKTVFLYWNIVSEGMTFTCLAYSRIGAWRIINPADTRRNNNVIMTSKRRHDVVLTS